jgi:hypothetical protein
VAAPPNGIAEPFPIDDPALLERVVNAGDLNADGRDDFLMGLCNPSRVEVVLSSPDGYGATALPSGVTPATVAAGDVNADGVPDLIVAGPLGYMFEFRYGLPGGGFGDPFTIRYGYNNPAQTCDAPVRVMVEDVDGDGATEMVVVGRVQVSLGAGVASVMVVPLGPEGPGEREDAVAGEPWSFNDLGLMTEARLSDVDHDGDKDLVVLVNRQTWLCRMVDGVFGLAEAIGPQGWTGSLLADVNGDGMPDLIQPSSIALGISLLHPDGSVGDLWVSRPSSTIRSTVSIGDVDGDQAEDIVEWRGPLGVARVLTRLISGTPEEALLTTNAETVFMPARAAGQQYGIHSIATGLLTHHARFDEPSAPHGVGCLTTVVGAEAMIVEIAGVIRYVVLGNQQRSIRHYRFGPHGEIVDEQLLGRADTRLVSGDFNADGLTDVASLEAHRSRVEIGRGTPEGNLVRLSVETSVTMGWPVVVDVEGDGRDEIVVVSSWEPPVFVRVLGDDSFSVLPLSTDLRARYAGSVDVDGDGYADLILADADHDRTMVSRNDTRGGFEPPVLLVDGFRCSWSESVDLDLDGFDDLVLVDGRQTVEGSSVLVFWGTDAGLGPPLPISIDESHFRVRAVDVDGNGLQDLVFTISSGGPMSQPASILYQDQPRRFDSEGMVTAPYSVAISRADINSDGSHDLILQHPILDQFAPWVECGAIVLLGEPSACPADLNGDGLLNVFDLAAYLDLFSSGQPPADLAAPPGVFNFFDVAAYLQAFGAGCP